MSQVCKRRYRESSRELEDAGYVIAESICPVCMFRADAHQHSESFDPEEFTCVVCGAIATDKIEFNRHQSIHKDIK